LTVSNWYGSDDWKSSESQCYLSFSFISTLQKYKAQKKAEELMQEAEKNSKQMKGGKEKNE